MKKLFYNSETDQIQLTIDDQLVRYTSTNYLPDWWQGLEGEALAKRGQENMWPTIGRKVFDLRYEDCDEVKVYISHNREVKVLYRGYVRWFRSRYSAESYLESLLGYKQSILMEDVNDYPFLQRGDIRGAKTYKVQKNLPQGEE